MTSVASISTTWIPEDDLLLKNAVEAGASLEALAKGAVQFSRRFTFRELSDRWYSLLYDPDISAQSSARMVELELSGSNSSSKFNRLDNSKGSKQVPEKRKIGSIRSHYYAMRKRMRSELFNSTDLDFLDQPNLHDVGVHEGDFREHVTFDNGPQDGNCMLDDCISNHFGLQAADLEILRNAFPETIRDIGDTSAIGNINSAFQTGSFHVTEDISAPVMPVNMNHGDMIQSSIATLTVPNDGNGKTRSPSAYNVVHSETLLCDRHHDADFINSTAVSEGDFADLSHSLLNFSNEDGVSFMDLDGKDSMDKSCYDNINSLLLCSPNDVQEDALHSVEPTNSCLATPSGACPLESENVSSPVCEEQQIVCHSEDNVPSTSVLNQDSHELTDGSICCTLNTEDQDIPCNDDIFLLIHHPSMSFVSSETQPINKDSIDPSSSFAKLKDRELGLSVKKKEKDPEPSFMWSQMAGPNILPETIACHPLLSGSVKSELPDTKSRILLPIEANKVLANQSQCRLTHAISNTTTDRVLEEKATKVDLRGLENSATFTEMPAHAEADFVKTSLPESVINFSASDHEEPESETDVPCFSDIEAMILKMDLSPYDQDSYIRSQVSRYQYEDTKRTIIRLEQCARSSSQRAMASQGALAVLYGRHLKHYVRKTEVLLGRSTEDVDVDIDLRKEGRANKISRRQAIIKMEADGSFFLKNLGRSSISVNGKEVTTGQLLSLCSNCLIEISGMSFLFEINQKYVRRCLDKIVKKCQGKNNNFEWSSEEP